MLKIPDRWFFLDIAVRKSIKIFHNITNKDGIVFYNKEYNKNTDLFDETQKLINICKKKKISFLISGTVSNAIKNKALGVYMPLSQYILNTRNKLDQNRGKPQIIYATSVHSKKEILLSNKLNYNLIFISPAFKTMTHKEMRPHNVVKFINLCKFSNAKIYALGGVSDANFQLLKNKHLSGFGAITNFKNLN